LSVVQHLLPDALQSPGKDVIRYVRLNERRQDFANENFARRLRDDDGERVLSPLVQGTRVPEPLSGLRSLHHQRLEAADPHLKRVWDGDTGRRCDAVVEPSCLVECAVGVARR
jgi:hypothetical protein